MRVATIGYCLTAYLSAVMATITPPTTGIPQSPVNSPAPPPTQPQLVPPQNPSIVPPPAVNAACVPLSLNADTWNRLQIDKYLAEYPGGNNITLAQYADSKDAQNFRCGIEQFCTIGQICNPVPAPDWYVLLAVQEWNNCMNSVFKAVHYAVTTVQGTLALMVTSLAEPNFKYHDYEIAFGIGAISALLAAATAILGIAVAGLFLLGYIGILGGLATAFGLVALDAAQVAPAAFLISDLLRNKPLDKKSFIKWSSVGNAFSQWEMNMHSMITNTTQTVINSPISAPVGISGVVRNGTFLFEAQPKSTSDLQVEYETFLQARSLNLVLRSMGAYVARGTNKCDGRGPNGALEGDHHLSYCGPDKIMMNIVLARGDETINKIANAKAVSSKFGFTTEYIVNQSWNCQQKYGKFEFDPYQHAPIPSDPYADCVMNLPVCDLTDQKINLARHGHHHSTTKACRNQGGLPI